jgi:6-phosphogluconolactonase
VTSLPEEAPPTFEVRVLPEPEELARAASKEFAGAARDAVQNRGVFRVVLSGGSTPRALYRLLAAGFPRRGLPWRETRFFFGDERCVPPEDQLSNYRMAKETLISPLGISEAQVLRMAGEDPPPRAARLYEEALRREFLHTRTAPRFDLVLLGLGADGHTASLFPGSRVLLEKKRWVAAVRAQARPAWRLTLTLPVLNAARRILFLVSGREKSAVAAAIVKKERGHRRFPASRIEPRRGSLLWLLDEEVAGGL